MQAVGAKPLIEHREGKTDQSVRGDGKAREIGFLGETEQPIREAERADGARGR